MLIMFFLFLVSVHWNLCLQSSSRSYSIDKSPSSNQKNISRSESLRMVSKRTHRIFRPSDLIHGEVLGRGCFGQAIKVRHSVIWASIWAGRVCHACIVHMVAAKAKTLCVWWPRLSTRVVVNIEFLWLQHIYSEYWSSRVHIIVIVR